MQMHLNCLDNIYGRILTPNRITDYTLISATGNESSPTKATVRSVFIICKANHYLFWLSEILFLFDIFKGSY